MANRLKKRNPELQFLKKRFRPSPSVGVQQNTFGENGGGLSTLTNQLHSLTRKLKSLRTRSTKETSHVHEDLANIRRRAIREVKLQETALKAKLVEKYSEVLDAELNLVDELAINDIGNERIKKNAKTLRRNIVKNRVIIELEKKKGKELVSPRVYCLFRAALRIQCG